MCKLDRPLLFIALWIRDLLSIQHLMDSNTGTCVEMAGMSITKCLYLLGNAESHACGSPKPLQVQITPARPSRAPRNVHDLTNEISTAGGPPSPDEAGNSITPGTRDLMDYFTLISEDRRAFDQHSAFEEVPFIQSWDDSDSDSDHHHHQSLAIVLTTPEDLPIAQDHLGVPSTGGKTQHPAGKSPGTELTTRVFSHGGLMKAPSRALLGEIEREDISLPITHLAGHDHLHDQPTQTGPEQDPVQPPDAVPVPDSAEPPERPSTGHSNVGASSSSATQGQSQPESNASVGPPSDGSAELPREDDLDRAEHASDPSTSTGSLVAPDNASDNPSISPSGRRNPTRPRKGVPTEEEKKRPEYQSRKYPCSRPGCGARFHRSDNRDRHIKTVHDAKLDWTCPVRGCAKRCNRWDNGMQHLQMEHDSACRGCGVEFKHPKDLYDHWRNPEHP